MTKDHARPPSGVAMRWLASVMLGGVVVIVCFALSVGTWTASASTLSVGLFIAGSAALLGGLLGFLFGIPRSLQGEGSPPIRSRTSDGKPESRIVDDQSADSAVSYRANTNLEQISDWLTKILVGVGLTQLTQLPQKLQSLSGVLGPALSTAPNANVMAASIVIYFTIAGFLFGYLWTRLFLAGALREADVAALGEKISDIEKQMSRDARALSLVQQHLNPQSQTPDVPPDELRQAIMSASPPAQTAIFTQAWDLRSKTWRNDDTKALMERTIPVFRALVDADVRNENHSYHGQLGFALKDKREPDWTEAEKELSKAIAIRGDWQEHGWLFYEFNRALARINNDASLQQGKASTPADRNMLRPDLTAIAANPELLERFREEPAVREWEKRNKVTVEDFVD